jgi:hypothetical protein
MRTAATLCVAALVVGCGGGSDALRASLDDVDPSGGFWTIRATCTGGHLEVEFRPGEQLSVPGLGHASSEEIAVECGKPERVAVSDEELRRHTPTGADLAQPTFEPTRLSCVADGSLVVEAHPVFTTQNAIVGGGFRVRRGGDTIVRGAIAKEEEFERADATPADPPSLETTVLSWSPCHTIPLGPNGTLQVVRVRDNDEPRRSADDEALF